MPHNYLYTYTSQLVRSCSSSNSSRYRSSSNSDGSSSDNSSCSKGPFNYYVRQGGGGGVSSKCLFFLTGGRGGVRAYLTGWGGCQLTFNFLRWSGQISWYAEYSGEIRGHSHIAWSYFDPFQCPLIHLWSFWNPLPPRKVTTESIKKEFDFMDQAIEF